MVIDVVVPVYRGFRHTQRCLESVLSSNNAHSINLVVIDDASPEDAIKDLLSTLARNQLIKLIVHAENQGFVRSVNQGLVLHTDRDVVILNSDTEVPAEWLPRLLRAAYSSTRIGTVTPFSNNATICSYPFHGWGGGIPGGLGLKELDTLFARENSGQVLEIPTSVGYCTYMRRDCINEVGLFDEVAFGRGYGEENDYSMRCRTLGWINVLATDLFVFHEGSVSFGREYQERSSLAMQALLNKHPHYMSHIHEFIARDPVDPYRCRINAARSKLGGAEANHVITEAALRRARAS